MWADCLSNTVDRPIAECTLHSGPVKDVDAASRRCRGTGEDSGHGSSQAALRGFFFLFACYPLFRSKINEFELEIGNREPRPCRDCLVARFPIGL